MPVSGGVGEQTMKCTLMPLVGPCSNEEYEILIFLEMENLLRKVVCERSSRIIRVLLKINIQMA